MEELVRLEQQILDDLTVSARQIQIIHWNLKTDKFMSAHPFFGEVYEKLVELIDQTAEQIHAMQKYPIATLKHSLDNSTIQEIGIIGAITYEQAIAYASFILEILKKNTETLVAYADQNGFFGEVELYSGHILYYQHILYFLHSSIAKGKFEPDLLQVVTSDNADKDFSVVQKFYDDEQLVFGWASIAKDKMGNRPFEWQGDIIDAEDLEPAVYDYVLQYRDSNEMHIPDSVNGKLVESIIFTKEKMSAMGLPIGMIPEGWWVGFKIENVEVYKKVKAGIYKMFSIEGSAIRKEVEE